MGPGESFQKSAWLSRRVRGTLFLVVLLLLPGCLMDGPDAPPRSTPWNPLPCDASEAGYRNLAVTVDIGEPEPAAVTMQRVADGLGMPKLNWTWGLGAADIAVMRNSADNITLSTSQGTLGGFSEQAGRIIVATSNRILSVQQIEAARTAAFGPAPGQMVWFPADWIPSWMFGPPKGEPIASWTGHAVVEGHAWSRPMINLAQYEGGDVIAQLSAWGRSVDEDAIVLSAEAARARAQQWLGCHLAGDSDPPASPEQHRSTLDEVPARMDEFHEDGGRSLVYLFRTAPEGMRGFQIEVDARSGMILKAGTSR